MIYEIKKFFTMNQSILVAHCGPECRSRSILSYLSGVLSAALITITTPAIASNELSPKNYLLGLHDTTNQAFGKSLRNMENNYNSLLEDTKVIIVRSGSNSPLREISRIRRSIDIIDRERHTADEVSAAIKTVSKDIKTNLTRTIVMHADTKDKSSVCIISASNTKKHELDERRMSLLKTPPHEVHSLMISVRIGECMAVSERMRSTHSLSDYDNYIISNQADAFALLMHKSASEKSTQTAKSLSALRLLEAAEADNTEIRYLEPISDAIDAITKESIRDKTVLELWELSKQLVHRNALSPSEFLVMSQNIADIKKFGIKTAQKTQPEKMIADAYAWFYESAPDKSAGGATPRHDHPEKHLVAESPVKIIPGSRSNKSKMKEQYANAGTRLDL